MAEEQQGDYLVPVEEFLKSGVHIGTKFKTESMKPFIYKIRPDGLAVLNIQKINDQIETASKFLSRYEAKDIIIACRRENGWKAVKKFAELTGVNFFVGRYPPGVMTNIQLENFVEAKLLLVCDPFPDKNAVEDALRVGIPVISLCDTNNKIKDVDLVVPCNNKGKKSLALIFWLLAREFLKQKGIIKKDSEFKAEIGDFAPE